MSKELIMTIPQFNLVQRGELTYREIKELNKSDTFMSELIKDKRIEKMLIFTIASIGVLTNTVCADTAEALAKVDTVGAQMLNIIQRISLWVCILGCIMEILISVFKKGGGQKEVLSNIFKWLLIFTSFYLVPALFKFIVEAFM